MRSNEGAYECLRVLVQFACGTWQAAVRLHSSTLWYYHLYTGANAILTWLDM